MTVLQLAEAIRTGQLSSEEVVQAHLERIELVNPTLNAVVLLRVEGAIEDARRADLDVARGRFRGPLHGVPMTIKDSFDTHDVISTSGTLGRRSFIPARDATTVGRLREAGAILLGKTNTPELTMSGETDNLVYGRTVSPFNPGRTPGGSSGGPAAIVAAYGSPFDLGSDTGGSIRWPAHCCGIAGIKPMSGRVPRTGHIVDHRSVLESFTQIGPMARSVGDLDLILRIIAGEDGVDPHITNMPLASMDSVDLPSLRIAFYTDNGVEAPTPEIIESVRSSARLLGDAGAQVTEARPPGVERGDEILAPLLYGDPGGLRRLLSAAGTTEHSLGWLDDLSPMSAAEYDARFEEVDRYRSTMFGFMQDFDVILSPAAPTPATRHGEYADETESYLSPYNLAGYPAAVVRAGTSNEGLPVGLQVVGGPWRSDIALAVAQFVESELGPWPGPVIP